MKNFILILTIVLVSATGFAQESLGSLAKLNRLSRTLKGQAPSHEERLQMQAAIASGTDNQLLALKLDEYLRSEEHAYKMSVRLEDLFRVRTGQTPIKEAIKKPSGMFESNMAYARDNSLNYLFREMATKNLRWDELLTRKSYRAFYLQGNTFSFTDWGFFAGLIPDLKSFNGVFTPDTAGPNASPEILHKDINFNDGDARIAGALTTTRFFTRYTNTGVNKNRRRAAAIFRIFLCDSMTAAVSSSEGMENNILDLMFPHTPDMTEDSLRKALTDAESMHGTQPDCMACHYKLDPMGKTMLTSQSVLSPTASAGRLTYKKSNGTLVDIPVKGIGPLGAAITQQEEYKSCQVRHFWKWFMGDRELTKAKEKELVAKFDQVDHRTNDFVKHIVSQPEFFTIRVPLTEFQSQARSVKVFFQKCQDCHKDQFYEDSPDFKIPDFTQWPIGGDADSMKHWVRLISKNMDISNDGENPRMPPTMAAWRSSYKEVELIKKWINQGAPDDNGQKMLIDGGAQ